MTSGYNGRDDKVMTCVKYNLLKSFRGNNPARMNWLEDRQVQSPWAGYCRDFFHNCHVTTAWMRASAANALAGTGQSVDWIHFYA